MFLNIKRIGPIMIKIWLKYLLVAANSIFLEPKLDIFYQDSVESRIINSNRKNHLGLIFFFVLSS